MTVLFVLACVGGLVVYEIVAALSHRFWSFRWLTISEMVWHRAGVDTWSLHARRIGFVVFVAGFVVLGGHFFFSWLRG
jgi:hypothetical protein